MGKICDKIPSGPADDRTLLTGLDGMFFPILPGTGLGHRARWDQPVEKCSTAKYVLVMSHEHESYPGSL